MRQAISRPPSKPVHPRDVDHADPDEYRDEGGPCKRDHGSGRHPFTRAITSRRAMLNAMSLPHGTGRASQRKHVLRGNSVSVRVHLGGIRIIEKTTKIL